LSFYVTKAYKYVTFRVAFLAEHPVETDSDNSSSDAEPEGDGEKSGVDRLDS
jgi:hypothetical protein